MNQGKILANLKWAYPELRALMSGNYPGFVTGNNLKCLENEIIVFSFHTPDSVFFEKQIKFLAENGYRTIDTEKLHDLLSGQKTILPNTVMLTFDDCRASLWSVVAPVLEKYGLRAVAYLAPFFIENRKKVRSQWSGDGEIKAYLKRDFSHGEQFCSWEEITLMHDLGQKYLGEDFRKTKAKIEKELPSKQVSSM